MTNEERAARAAAGAAAKAAKRAANKANWKFHPANANAAWMQRQTELKQAVAPEVSVTAVEGGSASLASLRALMADTSLPIHRRIDAAEVVLSYELGAASLAGADPNQPIAAASFKFLQTVATNQEVPEALRFRCLKSIAAIENTRASRSSTSTAAGRRELLRRLVNGARGMELRRAGVWDHVIETGQQWALLPTDQFDEPELPAPQASGKIEEDGRGIGAVMHNLARCETDQHAALMHQALLEVRAKNRPDDWRQLLSHTG